MTADRRHAGTHIHIHTHTHVPADQQSTHTHTRAHTCSRSSSTYLPTHLSTRPPTPMASQVFCPTMIPTTAPSRSSLPTPHIPTPHPSPLTPLAPHPPGASGRQPLPGLQRQRPGPEAVLTAGRLRLDAAVGYQLGGGRIATRGGRLARGRQRADRGRCAGRHGAAGARRCVTHTAVRCQGRFPRPVCASPPFQFGLTDSFPTPNCTLSPRPTPPPPPTPPFPLSPPSPPPMPLVAPRPAPPHGSHCPVHRPRLTAGGLQHVRGMAAAGSRGAAGGRPAPRL